MVSLSCGQYRHVLIPQDRHSQLGKKQWLCWVHLLCGWHLMSLQPWPETHVQSQGSVGLLVLAGGKRVFAFYDH